MASDLRIGDFVKPVQGFALRSGCEKYNRAVVVHLTPLVLVSEFGDMMWQATVNQWRVVSAGRAGFWARWRANRRFRRHYEPKALTELYVRELEQKTEAIDDDSTGKSYAWRQVYEFCCRLGMRQSEAAKQLCGRDMVIAFIELLFKEKGWVTDWKKIVDSQNYLVCPICPRSDGTIYLGNPFFLAGVEVKRLTRGCYAAIIVPPFQGV